MFVLRDVTELARLRRNLSERYRLHNIIGKSKPIQDVFHLIEQVAGGWHAPRLRGHVRLGAVYHGHASVAMPLTPLRCRTSAVDHAVDDRDHHQRKDGRDEQAEDQRPGQAAEDRVERDRPSGRLCRRSLIIAAIRARILLV